MALSYKVLKEVQEEFDVCCDNESFSQEMREYLEGIEKNGIIFDEYLKEIFLSKVKLGGVILHKMADALEHIIDLDTFTFKKEVNEEEALSVILHFYFSLKEFFSHFFYGKVGKLALISAGEMDEGSFEEELQDLHQILYDAMERVKLIKETRADYALNKAFTSEANRGAEYYWERSAS